MPRTALPSRTPSLLAGALALSVLTAWLSAASGQTRPAGERPMCVQVSSQARFDGVGFQHWVTVNNTCEEALDCTVTTDVAPAPVVLHLAAHERREISTFLSSPAREFTPRVDCTERR